VNRIADVLLEPLFVALLLIAFAYLLAARAPRVAFVLPALAFSVLLFFATPLVANSLQRGLEDPPLTTVKPDVTYDAVIVLGGGMNGLISNQTRLPAFNEGAERVTTAFDLLRTNRAKNAILSGGNGPGAPPEQRSEARLSADVLEGWGIDPSRLVVEGDSTTTHENAVASVKLARERGWTRTLLVTSAAHMERARGCFVREGLAVDTFAVDFASYDQSRISSSWPSWLPRASALAESTGALRERFGRFVYRLRGWTE
jgi:uncharacterized SAM-binding protein YcdF (DUF218 family)